jgi:hypothetical protein
MGAEEIGPYPPAHWCRDLQALSQGETLACPACESEANFGPRCAPRPNGDVRLYRACKSCGFWQEANGTDPYRCVPTVHECPATIPAEESCSSCEAVGPLDGHRRGRILKEEEMHKRSYVHKECQTVLGPEHRVPWPGQSDS